ncbi:MAG: hypothetical protein JWO63_179 [Frankiales bacterium]|nr:hypothetical protein [Frankiales bacterium]
MRLPGPPAEPAGGQPTVRQIPVGLRHAVGASLGRHGTGPGRERTACGLDATGFHCFEQLDWITTVNQCPDCGQAMAN